MGGYGLRAGRVCESGDACFCLLPKIRLRKSTWGSRPVRKGLRARKMNPPFLAHVLRTSFDEALQIYSHAFPPQTFHQMPPRLPTLGAPALPSPCLTRALFSSARALFSSTARAGFDFPNNRPGPAFDFPNRPPPPPASSTSKLLSLDRRHGPFSRGAAPRRAGDAAERLIDRYRDRAETAGRRKQAQIDLMYKSKDSQDYLRQMPRRFEAGDVYSPHDLSSVEMAKWRRRRGPRNYDVIDTLGIRPLDMYKVSNVHLVSVFQDANADAPPAELFPHPRLHLVIRPSHALLRHRPSSRQPAQDCKDDSPRPGHGHLPQHPRPPRDVEGGLLPPPQRG